MHGKGPSVYRRLTLLFLPLLLTGCASIGVRKSQLVDGEKLTELYTATRVDLGFMGIAVGEGKDSITGNRLNGPVRLLMIIMGLIDLPFSLATDTLFLPYDFFNRRPVQHKPLTESPSKPIGAIE